MSLFAGQYRNLDYSKVISAPEFPVLGLAALYDGSNLSYAIIACLLPCSADVKPRLTFLLHKRAFVFWGSFFLAGFRDAHGGCWGTKETWAAEP